MDGWVLCGMSTGVCIGCGARASMSGERGDGIESVACNDDGKRELDVRGDDRKKQDDTSHTGVGVTRRDQRSRMT